MYQGPYDYREIGSYNVICDVCGFKRKAENTRIRWDGARVCDDDFEPRHPQDFVTARKDRQTVPNARPDPQGGAIVFRTREILPSDL